MFQFPAYAPTKSRRLAFNPPGCPIRISPDQFLFADPRSFSQLTTSFFAFGSLGILRSLLFSFSSCESHFDDLNFNVSCFTRFAYEIAALTTRKNFDSYQTIISFYLVISLSIVNELKALHSSARCITKKTVRKYKATVP